MNPNTKSVPYPENIFDNIQDSGLKKELQTPGTELVSYEVSREY